MKLLVTGANGQLGNEIRKLAYSYPNLDFLFTDLAELDITDENAIEQCVVAEKITVIINCAAYTAVDKAELDQDKAFLINSTAVGNLARVCAKFSAFFVHVSTDYVFNGKGYRPYLEDDTTDPISSYAKSKEAGEEQVFKQACKAMIIRTSWLYSEFGANFVKTILKYGKERGQLNVVFDQIGTPTYARDLAAAILQIVSLNNPNDGIEVFHYANEGVASWYDFARAIVDFSGINCKISPIETKDYPLPAVRPFYSVFNKAKIKKRFQLEIPDWRDSLQECIGRIMNIE
ncbi:MAG: dTDP-4-dehydrorhamnose reductase [Bacteroidetes bacterium]|nr:dTDP-4-dehydrorhamnose reductase [Bacteroidota bacterium]